jgi:hypothetical protein
MEITEKTWHLICGWGLSMLRNIGNVIWVKRMENSRKLNLRKKTNKMNAKIERISEILNIG